MTSFVLDNSITMRWCFQNAAHPHADAILQQLANGEAVVPDVHRLAVAYQLTSYDAAYLELAMRRSLPIATLDNELLAASRLAGVTLF